MNSKIIDLPFNELVFMWPLNIYTNDNVHDSLDLCMQLNNLVDYVSK